MRTAALVVALAALGGCVSTSGVAPSAEAEGFPSLRDVPRTTIANTDAGHWAEVQTEMTQARDELKNNPRNEPAPPQQADEFIDQARQELEEARQAHPE